MRLTATKFCLCLTGDGAHGIASRRAILAYAMAMSEMGNVEEAKSILARVDDYYYSKARGEKFEGCDE